jgi:hypothetical protein
MNKFEREERYIVVKINQAKEHEDLITNLLDALDIPTVDCVVVEEDWPNYEKTWADIEAIANGTFDKILSENLTIREIEKQRDALLQEVKIKDCELDTQKGIINSICSLLDLRVKDYHCETRIKRELEIRYLHMQIKGATEYNAALRAAASNDKANSLSFLDSDIDRLRYDEFKKYVEPLSAQYVAKLKEKLSD